MSKNKTSQGLNQWTLDEKPRMEEFNEDNRIADKAISTVNSHFQSNSIVQLYSLRDSENPRVRNRDKNGATIGETICDVINHVMTLRVYQGDAYTNLNFSSLSLYPGTDNQIDLGAFNKRYKNIWAATGTIQTCDENTKQNIKKVDPQVSLDFLTYLGMPSTFEYIDGTSGRTHWGYTAQQVKAAMDRAGLSDTDFAGWINSPLEDEAGNPTGEHLQGLRYDELVNATLFPAVLRLMERVDQLEQRLQS